MEEPNYTDMFEAYWRGELSETEKNHLESLVEQDPALKTEFLLQKDIMDALQNYRKNEIKQRLAAIPIGVTSSYLLYQVYLKNAFLGLGAAGAISWGAYQWNQSQTAAQNQAKSEGTSWKLPVFKMPTKSAAEQVAETETIAGSEATTANKVQPATQMAGTIARKNYLEVRNGLKSLVQYTETAIRSFELLIESKAQLPQEIIIEVKSDSSNAVEVAAPIYYQFYKEKLRLYSSPKGERFSSRARLIPLELQGNTYYFLYFEGNYYHLKNTQQEITEAKIVKDGAIINQLKILKDKYFGNE